MRSTRRIRTSIGVLVAGCGMVSAGATMAGNTVAVVGKPVIGAPVAAPAQPVAGKSFSVSFKVTRGGAPLTTGKMTGVTSVGAQVVPHTESFHGGTARVRLLVPSAAAGKQLKVKVTVKSGTQSATKTATFRVRGAAKPALSIADVSAAEGNSGTTPFSFAVTLSKAATQAVTVGYATADGTATAPSDYAAASGTLTFQPGETAKTIAVGVVGDLSIESDETFTVVLSNPVDATIAKGTGTGTITNDDTASPVQPGNYQGATTEGNYVFFTVLPNRTLTGFRTNAVSEACTPGGQLSGSVSWGSLVFPIGNDGSFTAQSTWTGSQVQGDIELTAESWTVTGKFPTATTTTGTIAMNDEVNYQGVHYKCSSGTVSWTAALQG